MPSARSACSWTAARTPARSTGSPTSASRARRRATPTASACRPTTSSCAAGSAPDAQIGKALFRRVPSEELDAAVAGLIQGWLDGREGEDESFPSFARRQSDEELGLAAGLEPVKGRVREEAE